jgi:uncharacterized membrane protein
MMLIVLCLLIGIIAGLRAMTAPAAISWAASLGYLDLSGTWLAFLGFRFTPWIFTLVALGELVTDQRPSTPSRKMPVQFVTRLLMGGLSGAALGAGGGMLFAGAILGVIGAVVGTFGGAALRGRLAVMFGKDLPAALIEDAIAVVGAALIVGAL